MGHTARVRADPPAIPHGFLPEPSWCSMLPADLPLTQGPPPQHRPVCLRQAHSSRTVYGVLARLPAAGVCRREGHAPFLRFADLAAAWPLQQHPFVQLGGACHPVGPSLAAHSPREWRVSWGGAPRPLPLPRASSLATRPRRREEVGGLWDHAGVSLRHPIPSNPPGEAQDPEAELGIRVMGAPRQPPWILPAASQEPPLGACVQGLPRGHGETREGDLPSQPGCFAPSFLGLCLSPAPQCSSVTPCPPLSDPGGRGGSHVGVPTTCQGSVKRGHRRLRRPPQERRLPAGTRRPQHTCAPGVIRPALGALRPVHLWATVLWTVATRASVLVSQLA